MNSNSGRNTQWPAPSPPKNTVFPYLPYTNFEEEKRETIEKDTVNSLCVSENLCEINYIIILCVSENLCEINYIIICLCFIYPIRILWHGW